MEWSKKSCCFVRGWVTAGARDFKTQEPLRIIRYRFALETFSTFTHYQLVHYSPSTRGSVRSIEMGHTSLRMLFKQDPSGWGLPDWRFKRKIVAFEAEKIQDGFLVLSLSFACSLLPRKVEVEDRDKDDDHNDDEAWLNYPFRGRLYPWAKEVDLQSGYKDKNGDSLVTVCFSRGALDSVDMCSDFE